MLKNDDGKKSQKDNTHIKIRFVKFTQIKIHTQKKIKINEMKEKNEKIPCGTKQMIIKLN